MSRPKPLFEVVSKVQIVQIFKASEPVKVFTPNLYHSLTHSLTDYIGFYGCLNDSRCTCRSDNGTPFCNEAQQKPPEKFRNAQSSLRRDEDVLHSLSNFFLSAS